MSGCHVPEHAIDCKCGIKECKHIHKFHVVCTDCDNTVIIGLDRDNILIDLFDVTIVPNKQETITIKKALWDEMLESNKKLIWCIDQIKSLIKDVAFNRCEYKDSIEELNMRVKEVERFQDIAHEEYKVINKKKPNKCPLCEGQGKITLEPFDDLMRAGLPCNKICNGCQGKGILWN